MNLSRKEARARIMPPTLGIIEKMNKMKDRIID
jgi:hypothetical protein